MPRKVIQSHNYWCPEWLAPWKTCTRDTEVWEYVFSELKENGYGLWSSFDGSSEDKKYQWTGWAFNLFGSITYPSGTTLFFKEKLTSIGKCGSNNFGESASTGSGSLTGSNPESPNLNPSDTPPKKNLAKGGVKLYQQEDFNINLTGLESLKLISPSQFFGIGDFDLPVEITHHETLPYSRFRNHGLPPNTASSIRIWSLIQDTLYDRVISERHLGTSAMLAQDISKLSDITYGGNTIDREDGWNNKIVSIKVEPYNPIIWQPH